MALPRIRRPWSTIRSEIRILIRETVEGFWTNADLLVFANLSMDKYVMLMILEDEGWMSDTFQTDLTAGEIKYALPEGTGTVKQVGIVFHPGAPDEYVEYLVRDDKLATGQAVGSEHYFSVENGDRPTFRIVGNLLYLSRPPDRTVVNGLQIEAEFAPARLTGDSSVFDKRFPDVFETMVTYDVAITALEIEAAQGQETAAGSAEALKPRRDQLEQIFRELIRVRMKVPHVGGRRFHLGG